MAERIPPVLYRHLNPHTLRVLMAIAEKRSFAKAAEVVNLVPSAVTRRIQELEDALGVKVIERTSQSIEFTEAGIELLERARRILREIESIALEIPSFANGMRGRVRLGASVYSLFESLPEDLVRFSREFPSISVDLQTLSTRQVLASLHRKRIDLGIFAARETSPDIEARVYHEDALTLLVPSSHTLAERSSVKFTDFAQFDLIGPQPGTETEQLLSEQAKLHGCRLRTPTRVSSLDAIVRMAQAGFGIAVVPSGAWSRLGPFPDLRQVAIDEPWSSRQLQVGMLASTSPASPVRKLFLHLAGAKLPKSEPEIR